MDRVRSYCSKTAEENAIKLNASSNSRTLNSLHQVNIMLLELDLRMLLYFFRKLFVMRNPGKNIKLFFVKQLQNGVRVIYGSALYTGKYGNYNISLINKVDMVCLSPVGYGV